MTPIPARSETGPAHSDRVTRAATTVVGLVPVALVVIAALVLWALFG